MSLTPLQQHTHQAWHAGYALLCLAEQLPQLSLLVCRGACQIETSLQAANT